MASTYARLGSLTAAALLVFGAVPACSKSGESPAETSAAASEESTSTAGKVVGPPTEKAPATSAEDAGDTVVFEVMGTGVATTIDVVPAGDDRVYNVPLPWSTTVSIGPDVSQLQVVVVGSGDANPGCRITLNDEVVAEKPEGGDAQCVFDR